MDQELEPTKTEELPAKIDYKLEMERLQATNDRLLGESKKFKARSSRLQERETELDSLRKEKIDREGSQDEKISYYKTQLDELKDENSGLKADKLTTALERGLRKVAPDCHDINFILNNPAHSANLKASIDTTNGTIDHDVLKSVYKADKESNPYLYGRKKVASMIGGSANADTRKLDSVTRKEKEEMTPNEYREHVLNRLRKQK